jgi:predicted dehydrogenase
VLCEKPCGVDAAEVEEIVDACRSAGVQFMDGVMFMHNARLEALRAALDDGSSVGRLRRITSQFSFRAPDDFFTSNIRLQSGLEPLGCLGDLGWYNIRFALWVMNYALPQRVVGRLLSSHGEAEVPTEFSAEMLFADGVSASFYCSFLTEHQQWANVSGTEGNLHIDDFVLPFHGSQTRFSVNHAVFNVDGCHFHMERHDQEVSIDEASDSDPSAQETRLFRNFSQLVLDGTPDPHWPDIALKTQQVLDACLQSARDGGREVSLA